MSSAQENEYQGQSQHDDASAPEQEGAGQEAPGKDSGSHVGGAHMEQELLSQPQVWERAIAQAKDEEEKNGPLIPEGASVAVIGCGTSWFMAQSFAAARENAGLGVSDAFAASEVPTGHPALRGADYLIAITRSGTTTEVLDLLDQVLAGRASGEKTPQIIGVVADVNTPIVDKLDRLVNLSYADEESVVQTRFATSALSYLLTTLGVDVSSALGQAQDLLASAVPPELLEAEQFTFLGHGWSVGLAHEAALKMREAVQGWTESYPVKEYRHGPISIAAPDRVTWLLGPDITDISADVAPTGALFRGTDLHPLAELAFIHKVALERARDRGLDPDAPRNLTRSVLLEEH